MGTITFDTYKFIQELKNADFTEKQAEAVSRVFKDAQGEADVATRRDIERLEMKLEAESKLTRWMVGLSLALSLAILSLLAKLFLAMPH